MKFFRLDLLTLLISLFILNSCKNQDSIGLGITSSNQLQGTLIDTSTINANTVLEDTVVTSGALAKNPLAYFIDPVMGITQSDIATDLNLPSSVAFTPPTGVVTIDSARLVLKYADGFYGDSIASRYTVNVYQLKEKFNGTALYYNTKQWSVNTSLLGSLSFNVRSHDSIRIFNIISGAPDTLIKVPPQIRIPINTSFISTNLLNASSTVLSSNVIFQNTIKGLYITIDKTRTTGAGGILMIQPADSLAVYYRAVNGATVDTAVLYLPLNSFASTIHHTYSQVIQTELNNTKTPRGTIYLQGLAGLRAKISFPALLANLRNNLLKKDSDIVLNRAELVVSPSAGSTIPYQPLPKITMYTLDIANQRTLIEDASSTDPRSGGLSVFGGFYSKSTKEYHFIITAFLQDLLLKKTVDYGTYLAPVDTTNTTSVDIATTPQVGARTIAVGNDKSAGLQLKLNIIYTKILK
jgi:hypothetical protein